MDQTKVQIKSYQFILTAVHDGCFWEVHLYTNNFIKMQKKGESFLKSDTS